MKTLFTMFVFLFAGTVYAQDYTSLTAVSDAELAEFWEKIDGEMRPDSIGAMQRQTKRDVKQKLTIWQSLISFVMWVRVSGDSRVLDGVVLAICPERVCQNIECV